MVTVHNGKVGHRAFGVWQRITLVVAASAWLASFVIGTLINSEPSRTRFAALEGNLTSILSDGLWITITYTLTNVAILCVLASLLGTLGASAGLGADHEQRPDKDTSAPLCSAILRGVLVYFALIAGVLMFGDKPYAPTQTQYVRLAGIISLLGFSVNYRPELFGTVFARLGKVFEK